MQVLACVRLRNVRGQDVDEAAGTRQVPFGRELSIERDDFMEEPVKKWFRLAPGREVRLRYACLITCVDVIVDPNSGEVIELRCTWDPESLGGAPADGRPGVKGLAEPSVASRGRQRRHLPKRVLQPDSAAARGTRLEAPGRAVWSGVCAWPSRLAP